MARKRSKPVADHVAANETEVSETTRPESSATASTPAEPDIFDRVIAARAAGQFDKVETLPANNVIAVEDGLAATAEPASDRTFKNPNAAQSEKNPARPPITPKISGQLPDPRSIDQISLEADSRKGAKMRLLRSYRNKDVWIQFEKKPDKEITEQLKVDGFRWEPRAEAGDRLGAWVKPLEPGREIRIMLDAERLFKDLGNQIRKNNGLEPVGMVGVGAG
jgi:hypothetical protein